MIFGKQHTELCFAETVVGVGRDGFDEKLNELISDYPNYEVKNIFKIHIDTVKRLKDTGDDSFDSLLDFPRIWATVIMEKKES
ncbi:hypothetical protein [Thomasclavelia cocleata]|uniref:hypothetical protein n=1 Tax=Thomasclavelia cocleata TaxID=69824 RepID=UPI00272EB460|nr:hypothetical protein [Thomasclavelia cocleata]